MDRGLPLGELKTEARGLTCEMKFIIALRGSLIGFDPEALLGSLEVRALRTMRLDFFATPFLALLARWTRRPARAAEAEKETEVLIFGRLLYRLPICMPGIQKRVRVRASLRRSLPFGSVLVRSLSEQQSALKSFLLSLAPGGRLTRTFGRLRLYVALLHFRLTVCL